MNGRAKSVAKGLAILTVTLGFGTQAFASFQDVQNAYSSGQYFSAARLAFNDANHTSSTSDKALAYYWVTESLVRAGLDQSALYFFIRTIQFQDRNASKKVLELAPLFIERSGADLMRKFLIKYTKSDDYSPRARNAYALVVTKDRLLKGDYPGAVVAASQVLTSSPLYPVALQLRATAEVMQNQVQAGVRDFEACADTADQRNEYESGSVEEELAKEQPTALEAKWNSLKKDASRDLRSRCIAGAGRALYELERFDEADRMYDQIPKSSFVWTDTLFEHAWNSYAREEYNRSLGKLVSYKSPALQFAFNSEVDVLMAQSYMALCLYTDAGRIIDDFNHRLGSLAKDVKQFVEANPTDARPYYQLGRQALRDKLHTDRVLFRFMNRFVRSPTFQALALSEDRAEAEKIAISRMDASRSETRTGAGAGFPGFLNVALDWRIRTIQMLGGIFVRNSMLDYHQILISDLEKMQFMKIDILGHQKQKLMDPDAANASERGRGNRIPVRRDDQLLWTFNGEFWNDEIGDYVFALESECGKGEGTNAGKP
jgi:tetratricopeptide (TPR) repeat protein